MKKMRKQTIFGRFFPVGGIIAGVLFFNQIAFADNPVWVFQPQHFGAALVEGGWMIERSLGTINVSPEFTFPLQFIYYSARRQRGDFGDQWFCPQMESNVLPKGKGILVWTQPSGGMIGLFEEGGRATYFSDRSGEWHAKISGLLTVITNAPKGGMGWQYNYRSGRLVSIQAPSGRELDYGYTGQNLSQIAFRDPQSGTSRLLVTITRQAYDRLNGLNVCGSVHLFAYENGRDGRLIAWKRSGVKKEDRFEYTKEGVLVYIQPGNGAPVVFQTELAPPKDARGKPNNSADQKKVANYRITDDGVFKYSYSDKGVITIKDKAGALQSYDFSAKRGVATSTDTAGQQIKTYYYRAPGQKYDGKLRRIEQGDNIVLVENRYEKATGNLIESTDRNGITTYYEYAPGWNKPIRVLRGTEKKKDVVARMKYDAAGNLVEQTDEAGKTTKISYNARGEIDAITSPDGNKIALGYDAYGHRTGVSVSNARTKSILNQKAEYGNDGKIYKQTAPDGQMTEYSYDAQGNISEVKQNGVVVIKYERDEQGQVLSQTDAIGRTTKFEHDARGHLLAERKPNGSTTKYEYDARGYRTAQTDGDGNRITFDYDPAGHLVEQKNPLGQKLTWTYNGTGRLTNRSNNVQNISYSYDDNGRLASIDYDASAEAAEVASKKSSNQKVLYEYDAKGRFKKISTPTNSVEYFYDNAGHIAAKQFLRGTVDRVIRYTYDAGGRKTSMVLSGRVLKSHYKML